MRRTLGRCRDCLPGAEIRREFFRVTPHEVLEVLKEHHVELVEFTELPAAEEFRLSSPEAEALPV
jgi:hypothetical protein